MKAVSLQNFSPTKLKNESPLKTQVSLFDSPNRFLSKGYNSSISPMSRYASKNPKGIDFDDPANKGGLFQRGGLFHMLIRKQERLQRRRRLKEEVFEQKCIDKFNKVVNEQMRGLSRASGLSKSRSSKVVSKVNTQVPSPRREQHKSLKIKASPMTFREKTPSIQSTYSHKDPEVLKTLDERPTTQNASNGGDVVENMRKRLEKMNLIYSNGFSKLQKPREDPYPK